MRDVKDQTDRRTFLVSLVLGMAFMVGCVYTDGKIEGTVSRGIDSGSAQAPSLLSSSWDFLTSTDYLYDSNYVEIVGGQARLKR
ncbi:MAG: hypothetical protein HC902_02730 [Calothrix sp. SM1_5_4]|nr:hypothetical protein [Calothrix sp. SM1_5_4]